jgi:hypothetical protein
MKRLLRGESGQALTEQALLLATLVGVGAAGGAWLMHTHPDLINALSVHARSVYFVVSLPF